MKIIQGVLTHDTIGVKYGLRVSLQFATVSREVVLLKA